MAMIVVDTSTPRSLACQRIKSSLERLFLLGTAPFLHEYRLAPTWSACGRRMPGRPGSAHPLSSPRRRGPIITKVSVIAVPATSPCCGVWVPACAGTTAESHCSTPPAYAGTTVEGSRQILYSPLNLAADPLAGLAFKNSNSWGGSAMGCKSALKSAALAIVASTALATTLWAQEGGANAPWRGA